MSTRQSVLASPGRSLRHVRAAQLRAKATRHAIVQALLGTIFLIGAIAYALAPDKHAQGSLGWMSVLLVLSTVDIALGLRTIARLRLRRRRARVWIAASVAWGLLSVALIAALLRV